jgi:hypothetical protein
MGYMHIDNLYKNQEILMFKECYALEKIHGTSAHVSWRSKEKEVRFFTGEGHDHFIALFDKEKLIRNCETLFTGKNIIFYGENFGGKIQGMKETYGVDRKFRVFDVKVDDKWLAVPLAEEITKSAGLQFVHYVHCSTDLESLNYERDKPSTEAMLAGCGEKPGEGVVLRPLVELTKNNGSRLICKHKRAEFRETNRIRQVSPEELEILSKTKDIADEWVTTMRLQHVLQKMEVSGIEDTPKVMNAMLEDIKREGEGEIEWSKEADKAIFRASAVLFKQHLANKLSDGEE